MLRAAFSIMIALVVLDATPAHAHQSSVKYIDLTADGPHVAVRLTIAPADVTEPLGLPLDAQPTVAEASVPAAAVYVRDWLAIELPDGARCMPGVARARPEGKFVIVAWDARCARASNELRLDLTRFFTLDKRHEAIVTLHAPGKHGAPVILRASAPITTQRLGGSTSIRGWIAHGMEHIYGGRDHVYFVIALLLVVVITRRDGSWMLREPLAALRSTAAVITGFTLAHSGSLIAASLGWIHLPSRLVESLIAVSIIYTAIENIVRPDVRWRFWLTVGFGLVHGLGFASMLEELLPPDDVVVPLLLFNLGVEIGQLTIVLLAMPVLWLLAWLIGAKRYRDIVLPVAGVALVLVGIKWLIERVFDVTTFTIWGM